MAFPHASRLHYSWTEGRPTTLSVPEGDINLWRPRAPPIGQKSAAAPSAHGPGADRLRAAVNAARASPELAAAAQKPKELPGRLQVRAMLQDACVAMGRTEGDVGRVVALLEEEWLCDPHALQGLSDDGWRQLRIPLGLKEALRRQIYAARSPPAAPPTSTKGTPGAAQAAAGSSAGSGAQAQQQKETRQEQVKRIVQQAFYRRAVKAQSDGSSTVHGGMKGLAHRFMSMDDNHNNKVSRGEFFKALKELQNAESLPIELSEQDMQQLWEELDADGSGSASFDEVVNLLGQPLNPRRKHVVECLFKHLDLSEDGVISVEDIRERYSRGGRTPPPHLTDEEWDKEIRVGLENFRKTVGGRTPDLVRLPEFLKYYEQLGRNIDSDKYFEEMITNAWRLQEDWLLQYGPPPSKKFLEPAAADVSAPRPPSVTRPYYKGFTSQVRLG